MPPEVYGWVTGILCVPNGMANINAIFAGTKELMVLPKRLCFYLINVQYGNIMAKNYIPIMQDVCKTVLQMSDGGKE